MLDKDELQKLYRECLEFWGFRKQARMVEEECAELILATSHTLRNRPGAADEMKEEVADVYLMVQQMIAYFGEEAIMSIVDEKSDRVKEKLKRYKEKVKNE